MAKSPILVIDDDPAILDTVTEILEDEGYVVEQAMNGAEGLKALERIDPALVVLDMRMPVLDGWGFMRSLHESGIQLKILVMTAARSEERREGRRVEDDTSVMNII